MTTEKTTCELDDDEDQDDEYVDPEVINELESIEREAADDVDEDDEDGPSEEEQAALMRESLEAAEDIRNYPDGTRILTSYWNQDQA